MKNKKFMWIIIGCAVVIGIVAAVIYGMGAGKGKEEEGEAITAMYVPYGEDGYIFASEQGGVFTVTAPEEAYEVQDINGNKISLRDLKRGNIVKIYGNGIMAESYPGQYPGVTKIKVESEGNPSDADQYQEIVDELYTEPDPAEPPVLQVNYVTSMADVTVAIERGGYEWVYMDKDGLSNAVVADSVPVLDWGELLADITVSEPLDLTLLFSEEPLEVEVVRYDSSLLGKGQEMPEGEKVTVSEKEGQMVIEGADGNYVYEVLGIWENGRATYGFVTVEK
ncbi:hypothetical protein C807_02765 [Lachnospiraceae bacterium 28-4]|nr:hypothetical protein C807_02765 [Lachnospiraceae bacterium 28-4]